MNADVLTDQLLFAFYGRVSTEDQQDPQASYDWQLTRSRQLIQPRGGVIVVEYFDIGHTRALPWQRRPKASQLLTILADPGRGFSAVVIGEPQRAFYGNQFSLTFPVFEHYGVQLWVPEVGGPIDPGSEAHDLAMTLFGSMSKGERMRVKTRVRAAMHAQTAIQSRFLGGRPPYGYRLVDAGPHPNPAKARLGVRLHTLDPDPLTAPVVKRIFTLFLESYGYLAIAELLTGEAILSPSGYDPDRNPHRDGRAWSKSAVRAILVNPRYTGYQVWNRQRRDEVLLDIDDVAAGYISRMRRNDPDGWVWSDQPAHQPLVSKETFDAIQAQIRSRGWRDKPHRPRATPRIYVLRRRLRCGLCTRRMEAHWIHQQPYYRCTFPTEYAAAKHLDHPRTVYLREADLLPHLDGWIAHLFDPPTSMPPSTRSSPPARMPAAPPRRCARSNRRWPTASASSPATERRWTPELTWRPSRSGSTTRPRNERAPRPDARSFALRRPWRSPRTSFAPLSGRPAVWCASLTALILGNARSSTRSCASRGSTSQPSGSLS